MITGLIAPLLTPFDDKLALDQRKFNALAKRLLDTGCSGLAPFGTTGEALSISHSERKEALQGLVEAGIDPAVMIPGTGLCNLPDTVDLCQHAIELGCAGVMTLPPFYFKGMSDEGLYEYFARLIDLVNDDRLKIYLYHIPQVSGVGLSSVTTQSDARSACISSARHARDRDGASSMRDSAIDSSAALVLH